MQHFDDRLTMDSLHISKTIWSTITSQTPFLAFRSLFKLSRMGFPIQLKSKEVKIGKEKTSQMIMKEKLSERAAMKDNGLR